jgi:hypothetical protein
MVESLGYRKVYTRLVPRLMIEVQKLQRRNVSSQLLEWHAVKGEDFSSQNREA